MKPVLDIIIAGGGINGAGIAADASGRGLAVAIYDSGDFASATSSASSKLIHGGLRYLEQYQFRLVSESLKEREVLLKKAPHIAQPMRFRLPHRPFLRPAWMIRCGLFLYDSIAKRTTLAGSHRVDLSKSGLLKPEIKTGFEYSDCWVDDARLVILNIQQAKYNGAEVANYCKVILATRNNGLWQVTLQDQITGKTFQRQCRALVNATGPWVKQFFDSSMEMASPRHIRLIKGSHIVVPKLHNEPHAYILQNRDKRIVFVIPYMDKFSLIGTTDVEYKGDPRETAIDEQETNYLIDVVNQHFVKTLSRDDIVWSYSGVRPLCDDESDSPQAITRDYTLELQQEANQAPLLSVFGGKLTTYRKLAEAAMEKLKPFFCEMGKTWTAEQSLPGGNFSCSKEQYTQTVLNTYPWLEPSLAYRYVCQFGTAVHTLLKGINSESDMGVCFSEEVYQCELDYMLDHEFVKKPQDLLWRRTKLGLSLSEDERQSVVEYIHHKTVPFPYG